MISEKFQKIKKGYCQAVRYEVEMSRIDLYTKAEFENIVRNSYSIREVISKLGYSTASGANSKTVKNRIQQCGLDISHFKKVKGIKRNFDNVFIKDSTASQKVLREHYKSGNYTEYVCSICGIEPFWQGKNLTLILDHVNGVNNDDRLENLRWVCPNCNQQLETTGHTKFHTINKAKYQNNIKHCQCGKIISRNAQKCTKCAGASKKKTLLLTKDELSELIKHKSFSEIGRDYNVTDNAVRKWCKKYNLPYRRKDINNKAAW